VVVRIVRFWWFHPLLNLYKHDEQHLQKI